MIDGSDGNYRITEPRLLNGAQTIGSFDQFITAHKDTPILAQAADRLNAIRVMCKVITQSDQGLCHGRDHL